MLNIELRIGPLIIVLFLLFNEISSSIQPRWSCYHHLLAGYQKSGIFPLAGHHSNIFSNIKCNFNENSASSEIHSALEVAHHLMNKRSVNYQISDIFYLRELVRRSHCQQTVSVNWKNVPEDGRGGLTFISLLNTSHRVEYNGDERQDFLLTGRFAGVRHLIPDEENYESNPFISATRLLCEHSLQPDCQFNGQIEIDLEANLEWSYSFAFKTDTTNQTLLTLRSGSTSCVVKIENDYFIRVDSSKPISICQLSDASWHTVTVKHNQPDQHFLQIDDYQEIELSKGLITDDTTTTLSVSVNGNIQLIDPTDTNDDCLVSLAKHRRRLQETVITRSLCNGCECSILTDKFDGLNRCADNENDDYDNSYSLRRDNDRLSMFYSKNAFDIDANGAVIPAISVTFKTDSDSGLVFFGFWQNSRAKGRLQVHFHYDTISTIYCQHRDEEKCLGCSIRNVKGFGRDEWIQTVLWGGGDEIHFAVDKSICRLESAANFSLAEIYAIPQFTSHESGLFIGGTWHEKKRHGLYKNEIEHQFFENTREKAPVLRGCIKNLFLKSQKADLSNIFEEQKELFLINPSDSDGFAVKFGCPKCRPKCSEDARCRSYRPIEASPQICDCADILQFNISNGNCEKRIEKPIVLSTEFLSQSEIVIDIPNSKAVLNKIWIQFSLPKQIIQDQTIIEFNSHREKLFNIRVDVDGFVHIQCHGQDDDRNAARKLSLIDDRIHMIQLERRTPIGTKHTAKKFDLYIDGWHTIISDIGKMILNNITIFASDSTDEYNSIIIYGFGLGYDYDEHFALLNPSNALHQIDIHSELIPYQFRNPILSKTAILDHFLWEKNQDSIESSQYGQIVDYTADVIEPEQLLSARWIMYSLFLTILLCLFISICIICYWCILRRKSLRREESGSQRTIMRDSPDYGPVKLRPNSLSAISSNDEDGSIGTDDTDLQAYRDIPSHRVKIYRESMVSILVPSIDLPAEAAIVKRSKSSASDQFVTNPVAPNESHAPLVKVNDD